MSDVNNENIENNQEENRNKPEGNRSWWKKLLGLNKTYGLIDYVFRSTLQKLKFNIKFFLLTFLILNINIVLANTNINYEHAYFKELQIKENSITGKPIKLKDGQLLFIGDSHNYIYNPKTSEIKKAEQQIENLYFYSPVLLNNDEILFVGAYTMLPSEKFRQEIYDSIFRNTANSYKKVQKYKKLNEEEKEAFYLPYFKDNKNFLKKYDEYKAKYDESMYSILYNPKTNKYRKAGKINERRRNPETLLLNDGNVLIWGGSIHGPYSLEIYNTKTEEYILINNRNWYQTKAFLLNDGRVFTSKGEIYDPKNETFIELSDHNWQNSILLSDGRIYNHTGKIYNPKTNLITNAKSVNSNYIEIHENRILYCNAPYELTIYNLISEKTESILNLSPIRSCYSSSMLLLKNNEVLIYNGFVPNNKKQGPISSILYADNKEIQTKLQLLNLETGSLKIIENKAPSYEMQFPMLLEDGKIIFNINSDNKYVILNPKKNK